MRPNFLIWGVCGNAPTLLEKAREGARITSSTDLYAAATPVRKGKNARIRAFLFKARRARAELVDKLALQAMDNAAPAVDAGVLMSAPRWKMAPDGRRPRLTCPEPFSYMPRAAPLREGRRHICFAVPLSAAPCARLSAAGRKSGKGASGTAGPSPQGRFVSGEFR